MRILGILVATLLCPTAAYAAEAATAMLESPAAIICLAIFVFSYALVLLEEKIHLRKSKPVILGSGLIWMFIAIYAPDYGIDPKTVEHAIHVQLEEFGALLLFLLVAMSYIGSLENRNVFAKLRVVLIKAGLGYRALFWTTGVVAFFLSPIADNLTTALVMGAVVISVGRDSPKFIALACINIVNAANAGGAFSPFGDITTLMVWQAEKVEFLEFFNLFIPSLVNFLVPAVLMTFFVPKANPQTDVEDVKLKQGARMMVALGIGTIATAVSFEQFLHIPAFVGMMTGLGVLMMVAYYRNRYRDSSFDIFKSIANVEWDTLFFFFGVIFSVGGLGFIGYLEITSVFLYDGYGSSVANISLGALSAIIDNIPVMFAVLTMDPELSHFQWLLITLTTGVGGSMLSIGSAAGVALMGTARGHYTFMSHLKWTPVLILGYLSAILAHFIVNAHMIENEADPIVKLIQGL